MGLLVGGDLSGFGVLSCSLLGLLDGSLFVLLLECLRLWVGFYPLCWNAGELVCVALFVCCGIMFWGV